MSSSKIERRTCDNCECVEDHDETRYAGGMRAFHGWIHVHGCMDPLHNGGMSLQTLDFCSRNCLRSYVARRPEDIADLLPMLTAGERLDVFAPFCRECGCDERVLGHPCYCMRDE